MHILRELGLNGLFARVREAGVTMPPATLRIFTRSGRSYEARGELHRDDHGIGLLYYGDQGSSRSYPAVFLPFEEIVGIELDPTTEGGVKPFKHE